MAGGLRRVGGRPRRRESPGPDRVAGVPAGTMRSSRSMSSKLSTTISPAPRATASSSSSSVLALPCSTSLRRVGARLQRAEDLACACHVDVQTLRPPSPAGPPYTGTTSTRTPRPRVASGCGTRPGSRGPAAAVPPPTRRWPGCRTGPPRRPAGNRRRRACRPRRSSSPAETARADRRSMAGHPRHASAPAQYRPGHGAGRAERRASPPGKDRGRGALPDQRRDIREPGAAVPRTQGRPCAVQHRLRDRRRRVPRRRPRRRSWPRAR